MVLVRRSVDAALVLVLATGVLGAEQKSSCSREVICVVTVEMEDRVEFHVQTFDPAPVTLTIQMELTNLLPSRRIPFTGTFAGDAARHAITLRQARAGRWSYRYTYRWAWGSHRAKHDDQVVYALPFAPGSRFRVTQGHNGSFTHRGPSAFAVDFGMPEGTPVHASRDGRVVHIVSHFSVGRNDPSFRDKANRIKILHDDGTIGDYVHLRRNGIVVRKGNRVRAGDLIGYSGSTGYTRGPHLHFEVHRRIDAHERQTIPVKFRVTEGGTLTPVQGKSYTAPRRSESVTFQGNTTIRFDSD